MHIIERMRSVESDPIAELALSHLFFQFADRLPKRQRQYVPKIRLARLCYGFPDDAPLTSSTAAKMAFSGLLFSFSAFS